MADIDEKLVNDITEKIKRELISSPKFLASLMKDYKLTEENIPITTIQKLMASLNKEKQPPVPRTNKPSEKYDDKGSGSCSKPIALANGMETTKIVADLLVGNNVFLFGKAGTGKTYQAKAILECVLRQEIYMINCSQWTSPIEIRGGQTIKGYTEGTLIKAWENGGGLILDELPKLDPNTAGLLNEALAEAADLPKFDKEKRAIGNTIPYVTNGAGQKIYKGQGLRAEEFNKRADKSQTYPEWYEAQKKSPNGLPILPLEFRFCVIGTGNTDMKTASKNYSGNQRQDYSLVDRFAGSYYEVKAQLETEMAILYPYVFAVGNAMREFLNRQKDAIESVSLRTMLNFNRTYEQEMLLLIGSPYADIIYDNEGKAITNTKTFQDSLDSFVGTLPAELSSKLKGDIQYTSALEARPSQEEFIERFKELYGLSPL
jgi:cobaltochelatase CobS